MSYEQISGKEKIGHGLRIAVERKFLARRSCGHGDGVTLAKNAHTRAGDRGLGPTLL